MIPFMFSVWRYVQYQFNCISHFFYRLLDVQMCKDKLPNTIRMFYLPTDAQENCFKKNIKIYIKTAPTCFGAIIIIRECIIWAC